MDKKFRPKDWEERLIKLWEEKKLFQAQVRHDKKPFVIILPPPNANGRLHMGHAMFVYEDVLIRYHKLQGFEVLWLPGEDHAGFETWYVFEQELKKKGKSRMDYDWDTLYKMVWDFVMEKRGIVKDQLKRLGFALDWSKAKFTLDPDIVHIVYLTFKKLYDQGLVYRAERLVNFCVGCGTSFSDLEVLYEEEEGRLWHIRYPLADSDEYLIVATTRPETMIGDTAVAVHPEDERYKKFIGRKISLPLVGRRIPVVADEAVDPEFGTGVVKVTPAHSHTDWQIAQRHNLPLVQIIDFSGKASEAAGKFRGLKISDFRKAVVRDLEEAGFLEKEEKHQHRVAKCYKCKGVIEPLPKKQWFVKIRPLAERAKELLESGEIKIYPKRFRERLFFWLENFFDWNISRQIVWGIRIPAYQCQQRLNEQCQKQEGWFVSLEKPDKCVYCGSEKIEQDKDTFDTWFSSGQWPYATLMSIAAKGRRLKSLEEYKNLEFFQYFYPTTVMETGYDILPWWVARMIMLGVFATGEKPFSDVLLHGLVRDAKGRKMSKSKGNVIDPMQVVDKFGVDALRGALIFNSKIGSDLNLSEDRFVGMRNFANKIWNIGRFIYLGKEKLKTSLSDKDRDELVLQLRKEFAKVQDKYHSYLARYELSYALDLVYEWIWHRLADFYIERLKGYIWEGDKISHQALEEVFLGSLRLLHPFLPFVTDAVALQLKGKIIFDL